MFEEFFVGGADHDGVCVTHHSDQHVQQQNGNQDLEEDKHHLRHGGIGTLVKFVILGNCLSLDSLDMNKFIFCYLIFTKGHVKQSDPCCHVVGVHALVIRALHDEVEGLREAEEEDGVDDREGEHVSSDHGENHRHKWSRQLNGSAYLIIVNHKLLSMLMLNVTLQKTLNKTRTLGQRTPGGTPRPAGSGGSRTPPHTSQVYRYQMIKIKDCFKKTHSSGFCLV